MCRDVCVCVCVWLVLMGLLLFFPAVPLSYVGVFVVLASDQERVQRSLSGVPHALLGDLQAEEHARPRRVRSVCLFIPISYH